MTIPMQVSLCFGVLCVVQGSNYVRTVLVF